MSCVTLSKLWNPHDPWFFKEPLFFCLMEMWYLLLSSEAETRVCGFTNLYGLQIEGTINEFLREELVSMYMRRGQI